MNVDWNRRVSRQGRPEIVRRTPGAAKATLRFAAMTIATRTSSAARAYNCPSNMPSHVSHPGYAAPPGLELVGDAAPAFQQGSGIGGQPNRAWMVSGGAVVPPCTDVPKDVFAGFANRVLAAEAHGFGAAPGQQMPVPAACGTSQCDVSLQKRINKDRVPRIFMS